MDLYLASKKVVKVYDDVGNKEVLDNFVDKNNFDIDN